MFYRINSFHLDTSTFWRHPDFRKMKLRWLVADPRHWWRSIGDSNLRLVHNLRVLNRAKSHMAIPVIDMRIERSGQDRKIEVYSASSKSVSAHAVDISVSTPEMTECVQQMQVDGSFVRGIEKALEGRGILDTELFDWPKVAGRSKGWTMISSTNGGEGKWVYWPESEDQDEMRSKLPSFLEEMQL